MKKCLVIGGGFAGLTASAYLANAGLKVELIEASPKLGGRAYSFLHNETNELIDNGQHIMMGCYKETLKFLKLITAIDKVETQKQLHVKFLKKGFDVYELKATSTLYPFNLLYAVLNYKAISFAERISIIRLFLKLPFLSNRDLVRMSVEEFLISEKQSENARKALWEIISIGALNTSTGKASAEVFVGVLKEIFLKGSKGPKIVLPKKNLSEMYCEPAKQFIEQMGGSVCLSEKVEEIKIHKGKAAEINTNKRIISDFDFVITAIPHLTLERISQSSLFGSHSELVSESHSFSVRSPLDILSFNPEFSSILNVHVWLNKNNLTGDFFALIGSKLHWVFSHDTHLTCVISDADYSMQLSDEEILKIIYEELEDYLEINRQDISKYFIIKEKRATFIPSKDILHNRPNAKTNIKNLFLAGDWVNTGLPSTIESAVKSGRMAADAVISAMSS